MEISEIAHRYFNQHRHHRGINQRRVHWKHVEAVFGEQVGEYVTEENCRLYKAQRLADGAAEGTAWIELCTLRMILKWARRKKFVGDYDVWVGPEPTPRRHRLTREEVKKLLENCNLDHIRLFVILAVTTGARHSAILDLKWDHINFETEMIDYTASWEERMKKRTLVPMNKTAKAALLEAKEKAKTEYVIEWQGSKLRWASTGLSSAAEKAGLKHVTPHVLRHTAGTWMAEGGIPLEAISQYLGHSSTKITEKIYARFTPGYMKKQAEVLEI